MRIDKYLFETGMTVSRAKAQEMLKCGAVTVDGIPVSKPSFEVSEGMQVVIQENDLQKFVGRGGLKLAAALTHFALSPKDCVALDVGASSGGFTDCLLQNGAAYVYALDSGSGQLHPTLREDVRVCSMEGFNARSMTPTLFPKVPTFCVMDVSFISQTLILPAISACMTEGGVLISLIKPQFELGREALNKNGVVKSTALAKKAISRVCDCAKELGFSLKGVMESPIHGGDGNIEFLAAFVINKK